MKKILQFLVNFMVRAMIGLAMIFFINQVLDQQEMMISVGINAASFVVTGCLGVPGVALLYGVVALSIL